MNTNFKIDAIPDDLPWHIAREPRLVLFGEVSGGIVSDHARVQAMFDRLPLKGEPVLPRFIASAAEAAALMFERLKAEVGEAGVAKVAKTAAEYGDEFGPWAIISDSDRFFGEKLLTEAFEVASNGRELVMNQSPDDDTFSDEIWFAFVELLKPLAG